MRIAIDGRVVADHFPGIGRYAARLVDALSAGGSGDEIVVLRAPGQVDSRHGLEGLARRPGVRLRTVRGGLLTPQAQWHVRRALAAERPDVFHATYWSSALFPGVPTVLSVYDLIGRRVPGAVPSVRGTVLWWIARLALRSAAGIVTLSEWSKRDLVAEGWAPEDRVTVTPLAADERFRPVDPDAVAAVRASLGLPSRYVLNVGINKPHKNLATLIAAWARLGATRPDVVAGDRAPEPTAPIVPGAGGESSADGVPRAAAGSTARGVPGALRDPNAHAVPPATGEPAVLVLAGPWDPRYPEVRAMANATCAPGTVRFLGPVADDHLPALYSGATAFVFPSRYEGFGLPPVEAMACGTPVVASDATSLPEVVGDAGLLVPPDDVDGWVDAIARVLTDPGLAADLGRRGRQRAARFSWAETARLTREAYLAAVRRRSGGR